MSEEQINPTPPSNEAAQRENEATAKAAAHTRRAFLFKLSLALNAAVGAVLAVPLIGFLVAPALKKSNATGAWIALGKLDANVMVDHLRNQDYSAVQMGSTVEGQLPGCHATPQCVLSILLAIQQYYRPAFQDKGCVIYLPIPKVTQEPPVDSHSAMQPTGTARSKG